VSAELPGLLTAHDMAILTGKSAKVWWRAAREGTSPVPVVRLGRDVLWPRDAVMAMLRGGPVDSDGPDAEVVELRRRAAQ
jgi:predicted DNA-binding transcriptional regulator AlpA